MSSSSPMSLKDATPAAEQIRNKRIDRLVPLASPGGARRLR